MDFFGTIASDKYARTTKPNTIKRSVPTPKPDRTVSSSSTNTSTPARSTTKPSLLRTKPNARNVNAFERSSVTPSDSSPGRSGGRSTVNTPRKRVRAARTSSSSSDSDGPVRKNRNNRAVAVSSNVMEQEEGRWRDVIDMKPSARIRAQVFNESLFESDLTSKLKTRPFIHSAELVSRNLQKYKPYFPSVPDKSNPRIKLSYPVDGYDEEFILISPKQSNEYDPIGEVLNSIGLMIDHYIPPSSLSKFKLPIQDEKDYFTPLTGIHPPATPLHSPLPSTPGTPSRTQNQPDPILRALHKAYNRKDLDSFRTAIDRFNVEIRNLRQSGEMKDWLFGQQEGKGRQVEGERWRELVAALGESAYQRTVGPETHGLSDYEPFSDYVYGELLPRFVFTIADRAKLGPESCFVDLGSGVGNCLGNISLYSGSSSIGCEYMPNPSRLARAQIKEIKSRWKMWGVEGNKECRAIEADFCSDPDVVKALQKADLVLVNNYAFTPALNDRLSLLFLELKDGTSIISLKPFLPDKFRLNDRNVSSPSAILRMRELPYPAGSVSWTNEGGVYYEHIVDRSQIRAFYEGAARRTSRRG